MKRRARDATTGKESISHDLSPKTKRRRIAKPPVDEACPLQRSSDVFVDLDDTVYDASLNLSSIEGNNNKYYYIQILVIKKDSEKYAVWTHWGRVGESGQNKLEQNLSLDAAKTLFMKKFKDKTGLTWDKRHGASKANKYAFIEKSYDDNSKDEASNDTTLEKAETPLIEPPECTLSPEMQDLITFLFNADSMKNTMASQNYNFNKLPLGKLSDSTIEKGYLALKDLGEVIQDPKLAKTEYKGTLNDVFNDLSSKYYTIILHDFGRKRPTPIKTEDQLKSEMELLENLGNMKISNQVLKETESAKDPLSIVHPLDARMASLGPQDIGPVTKGSIEFDHLEKYFRHADGEHRDATIEHIYRILRPSETERFIEGGYDAKGMTTRAIKDSRKLLWHGSRGCNFGGILSQGLRIAPPEAPPNSKAFGNGIYLADRACKSASYCDPWNSDQTGLLLLCETQLGDPSYIKRDHEYNAADSMRKKGLISTKMMTDVRNDPSTWLDAAAFRADLEGTFIPDPKVAMPQQHGFPNEYIVYDIAQVRIRYVFMLKWKTSRRWGIY